MEWLLTVPLLLIAILLMVKHEDPVQAKYQSAVIVSGLVTFIAAYNYIRIFKSETISWISTF